jgi:peptidoglycan hydrolase-like protein with peptidoglycan-binding domain
MKPRGESHAESRASQRRVRCDGRAVQRPQRALRRTPDLRLMVDGIVGPQVEAAVKNFQEGAGLVVSATVSSLTWNALPRGGPCRLTNDVGDQCITDWIIVAAYKHLVN